MPPPAEPKIYHIVHVDRLASIVADGALWSDAALQRRARPGTVIGMSAIKRRRLTNPVKCRPGLNVGDCVPFYFCPRSIMLYVLHMANSPELDYRGGQGPIVHLEADLHEAVAWADRNQRRWAFTLSNAGSGYFKDRCDLAELGEIDWEAGSGTELARSHARQAGRVPDGAIVPLDAVQARRRAHLARSRPSAGSDADDRSPACCRAEAGVVLLTTRRGRR